jgi:hypothetical protein
MTPLEWSVSDATVWSFTLESSITILEASFILIYDVYSTSVTCDNYQFTTTIADYTVSIIKLINCFNEWITLQLSGLGLRTHNILLL